MLLDTITKVHTFMINLTLWSSGIIITLGLLIQIAKYFDRNPAHSIVEVSH